MLAKIGVAAEVPSTNPAAPLLKISKLTAGAATSGKPLPEALYRPEFAEPMLLR
jgi:hypothetical protein